MVTVRLSRGLSEARCLRDSVCRIILSAILIAGLLAGSALGQEDTLILRTGTSALLADTEGNLSVGAGVYAEIEPIGGEGLYAARPIGGGPFGLIDAGGEVLTEFIYDRLENDDGRIVFMQDGLTGVMSVSGGVLIENRYSRMIAVDGGYLALKGNALDDTPDALLRVDPDGREHSTGIKLSFGPLTSGEGLYEAADTMGRWGYLNSEGSWAIAPSFLWCGGFASVRAAAADGRGTGIIDETGSWIVEPVFRRIEINDGLALCFGSESVALLDVTDGRSIAVFEGASADAGFTGDLIWVRTNGDMALYGQNGIRVFTAPDGTSDIESLDGVIIMRGAGGESCSFVDRAGEIHGGWQELSFAGKYNGRVRMICARWEEDIVESGGYVFRDEVPDTRRYAIVDEDGTVLPDEFLHLRRSGENILTAETETWLGLIHPDGSVIVKLEKSE